MKLSIVVPIYNAEKHIKEAVLSVLNQAYTNFELVLVNDGSTDGSAVILKEIKKIDNRIHVFSQENKGVTAARKLGWSKAKGKYITFLDADDAFYNNSLQVLMAEFEKDTVDIVNGSFVSVPSGKEWIHRDLGLLNQAQYLESFVLNKTFGVVYASVYKTEIIKESTFSFDKTIKIGEDVLMNIELCSRVVKVKNIATKVYKYTDDNSVSAMKVIVRHPKYFKRFFEIRNTLFKSINEDVFQKHHNYLKQTDAVVIVKSFFSPHIPFDMDTYYVTKTTKNNLKKKNIYSYCLSSVVLTVLLKYTIFALTYSRRKKGKKVILY
ncbi:glycosyltransferase family 2 protein [Algibacter mikhailovii]|uniref:glycosyltransferase family 2 protein n=1 Tax=Algibacter mikhailovii TaxID=425498 RepID=UPI00249503C7|nr:glycosyltransferase [Algibacter mikhailovii]